MVIAWLLGTNPFEEFLNILPPSPPTHTHTLVTDIITKLKQIGYVVRWHHSAPYVIHHWLLSLMWLIQEQKEGTRCQMVTKHQWLGRQSASGNYITAKYYSENIFLLPNLLIYSEIGNKKIIWHSLVTALTATASTQKNFPASLNFYSDKSVLLQFLQAWLQVASLPGWGKWVLKIYT